MYEDVGWLVGGAGGGEDQFQRVSSEFESVRVGYEECADLRENAVLVEVVTKKGAAVSPARVSF